jgi:hypothetical protein
MAYAGIDYGFGRTNLDGATGIRYGVISQHSLASWFYDSFEPVYGPATCPRCGNENAVSAVGDDSEVNAEDFGGNVECDDYEDSPGCHDYACHACRYVFDSSEAYGDEPAGHELKEDGYHAIDCLDSDVMLIKSPFYTFGPFCSPCVPGAVSLPHDEDEPATHGPDSGLVRAYCFGHDWFNGGRAPYRVFSVDTNEEVFPNV